MTKKKERKEEEQKQISWKDGAERLKSDEIVVEMKR